MLVPDPCQGGCVRWRFKSRSLLAADHCMWLAVLAQESFTKLRELKGEIEAIQRLLEKARAKLQAEFDDW